MANEEPGRSSPYLIKLGLLAAGLIIVAVLLWQWVGGDRTEEVTPMVQPEPAVIPESQPEPQDAPEVIESPPAPPEPEPEPEPLPELAESDVVALAAAEQLTGDDELKSLLVQDNVIQKSVRAVIAAADGGVVHEYRPLRSPSGTFLVEALDEPVREDVGQRYRLSPRNYERYDRYVNLLTRLEPRDVAAVFQRFYPLFEQAYEQHGVNGGSFQSLTLKAIDSLLAAPVLDQEPILVQPRVYYEFEDPRLEALPATQKLLIRMGPENTRKVQAALKELRSVIAAQQTSGQNR